MIIPRWFLKRGTAPALAAFALAAFVSGPIHAVPTLDGARDAEYVLVTSPNPALDVAGNLTKAGAIDDQANARTQNMDVVKMYAANTSAALYLYVELPNLDLATVYGDWTVLMHLGGANNGMTVNPLTLDPYAESIYLGYDLSGQPMPNAAIKANWRSGAASNQDGMNGWSDIVLVNGLGEWNYGDNAGTRNLFGVNSGSPLAAGTTVVSGTGSTGASIVYLAGAGIELMVPFSVFGQNPDSPVVAPTVGDEIKMQFLTTTRKGGQTNPNSHDRGAIDTYPYDLSARHDPDNPSDYSRGLTRVYGTYTLSQPAAFEVTGGSYRDATHITVTFSDPVGAGATDPANYALVDTTNSSAIAVTGAEVDPSDDKRVILTTATLPVGRTARVTVTNVRNATGTLISSTKNVADIGLPTPVVFRLFDPGGLAAGRPVTVVGSFQGWNTTNEIPLNPVAGQTNRYESGVVYVSAGPIEYKYRVPSDANAWNLLNPSNRTATVPVQSANFVINDTVLTPVPVTFHLVDPDNLADGRQITVVGSFNNWTRNDDGTINDAEVRMNPVAGQPNTYESAPVNILPDVNTGQIEYKYRIPSIGGNGAWDVLNFPGDPNRRVIVPAGSPPVTTNDIVPNETPVDVTFRLLDAENRARGKDVYVVGRFQNWNADPFVALKLEPVTGQPNTYAGTTSITQGYTTYKYVTIQDDPENIGEYIVNWDLFGQSDLFANIIGSGSPLAQTVTNTIGVVIPPAVRILRIAGGLEAAPTSLAGLDINGDSQVTIVDAVAAARGL